MNLGTETNLQSQNHNSGQTTLGQDYASVSHKPQQTLTSKLQLANLTPPSKPRLVDPPSKPDSPNPVNLTYQTQFTFRRPIHKTLIESNMNFKLN